jgi:hypothetical protein
VPSQLRKTELLRRGGIDPLRGDRRPLSQILNDEIPEKRWSDEAKARKT